LSSPGDALSTITSRTFCFARPCERQFEIIGEALNQLATRLLAELDETR
jgi:hypothetical protein